jgi:hypothetical protein
VRPRRGDVLASAALAGEEEGLRVEGRVGSRASKDCSAARMFVGMYLPAAESWTTVTARKRERRSRLLRSTCFLKCVKEEKRKNSVVTFTSCRQTNKINT